jgi:tetratricopeptide (TPR) repeat protein
MSRAARYKALYLLGLMGLLACIAAVPFEWRGAVVVGVAAALFLSARVVRFAWRDFYRGRRLQGLGEWQHATKAFQRFLGLIRRQRRLAWLVWLTVPAHTRDVEAMTLNNLGVCRLMLSELWEAEQYFLAARARDASYALPPFNLANVAYLRGDKDDGDAMIALARSLGCDPNAIAALAHRRDEMLAATEPAPPAQAIVDAATSPPAAPSTLR